MANTVAADSLPFREDFPFSLAISDPHLDDNPLVFVSDAFEELTGYAQSAVIGRNCRFLQGKDTDQDTVTAIRDGVRRGEDVDVLILNYRADGQPFWNRLMIAPLRREGEDSIRYFVAIQTLAEENEESSSKTDDILAEIQHRVKNHLSMVVEMIRLQARKATVDGNFESLARRVEALQLLYNEMSDAGVGSATDDQIPLGAYLTRIASAISHIDGRHSIRTLVDADKLAVPVETAARTGLVFSEILTNSLQHAFEGREEGVVEARVKCLSGNLLRVTIMDDGIGMPEEVDWPNDGNLGSRIVRTLVAGMKGTLHVDRGVRGTMILLDIPLGEQKQIIANE